MVRGQRECGQEGGGREEGATLFCVVCASLSDMLVGYAFVAFHCMYYASSLY